MTERYRFFDSVDGEDEREYSADEFAEYFRQLVTSGVFNGGENLRVITDGSNMTIKIEEGYAWLEGYLYKIDTEPLMLTLDSADPSLNRIDRIVIRLDKSLDSRYVKAFVSKGIPAEEPKAPSLTRDENIYEISLAQIGVLAGKSFIAESEITDERFDEDVCGIVNSLIKVDTSHLIKAFEDEWQTWYKGIKDETFVPIGDFRDGFIRTPEDLIYSTPDSKLQFEKGWPINRNTPKMELEGLGLNEEGSLYINTLKDDYVNIVNKNVAGDSQSQSLTNTSWLAIPFTTNADVKHLQITMRLVRQSIARIRSIICEAGANGLPDLSKEYGRYFSDDYGEVGSGFNDNTWEIELDKILKTDRQYFLVFYGYSSSYYFNAGYLNTPGQVNYYLSTNSGSTWTTYERTPRLIMSGKELVDEGVVTMDYSNVANFKKHGLINLKIIDNVNSYYLADVLDLNGNIVKGNITPGKYLFEDNLSKDTKVRIRLIKAGEEEPKLRGYEHLWVEGLSKVRTEQAIVPSNNTILEPITGTKSSEREGNHSEGTSYVHVKYGGRYRFKCELTTNNASTYARVTLYENGYSYGNRIGYASVQGNSYTPVTVDLDSVAPNSKIAIVLTVSNSSYRATIRNIELCGEFGYQDLELTDY